MTVDAASTISVANNLDELERVFGMLGEFADTSGVGDGVRTAFFGDGRTFRQHRPLRL